MSQLVPPHGSPSLKPLLLQGEEREEELKRAKGLKRVPMTSRETSDLIMMGIGAFTPLGGFMGRDDWKSCCDDFKMVSKKGLFWPIPITLSAEQATADGIAAGSEIALVDTETDTLMGTMKVSEKYGIDKKHECERVFRTTDEAHPGVQKVMDQGPVNLAGPVKVLSESYYPERFDIYQRPAEARKAFEDRGWSTVAALQLRNPMHGSHAYLAWVAIEVCDGVYLHQLVGKLKAGDIPAEVRVKAIEALVSKYFRKERVIQGGYPMEMRYAGPREALLHGSSVRITAAAISSWAVTMPVSVTTMAPSTRRRSSTRSPRTPCACAPRYGLDLLLLRVRRDGLYEDLPARLQGGHRR